MRDSYDMFQEPERGRFGENEQRRPGRGPRVTGASDLHDSTLILKQETPGAIAVVDPSKPRLNNGKWIWLPRSQIQFERCAGASVVVTMPEWLAVDKGFV